MGETQPKFSDRPLISQPLPGYWRTKRALACLERYKNLVMHQERWADADLLPLQDLFPGKTLKPNTQGAYQLIKEDIKQNAPSVFSILSRCGVPTRFTFKRHTPDGRDLQGVQYDVITDYFRLPRDIDARTRRESYDTVMEVLDQGIGAYKARLRQAKRDLWNPLIWLAYLVRIPITILERAGLAAHPKSQEILINAYGWCIRVAMLGLIVVIAVHYGIKIPWSEILPDVMKLIAK